MKALIFGANGQDGFYLTELLSANNIDIIGVSRNSAASEIIKGDVSEIGFVTEMIKDHQPEYIFHLAANSTTQHDALFENHSTISTGTLNILEIVKKKSPHSKVFLSGSGLQFKNEGQPIKETDQFEARDAYSVSRIQSVFAARYYRSLGLKIYVGYFFNHDSPKRTERHMSKKISEAVKRISNGSNEKLEIGNINVVKEWTYAKDIVEALWLLMQQEEIFEVNLGSGKGYSIKQWLKICFYMIGKNWEDHVVQKNNFIPEYQQLVCDPALLFSLGWKQKVSFEELAALMIKS